MNKINFKEIDRDLQRYGIGINSDTIDSTPHFSVYHIHEWDHGYDGFYGITVSKDGNYQRETGFCRTRREFYVDMREMICFVQEYFSKMLIQDLIIAPCYQYNQFSFNAEKNDIYEEIYDFLHKNGIRKGERSGVHIMVKESIRQIEMIIEGAFRGISQLCLFAPAQGMLISPNHHFGISFFTQNKMQAVETALTVLENFPTLEYTESL